MNKQTLKFVIVGHIDHGKSTLIGRLLYDTNSLPPDRIEEIKKVSKEQGKETEFAYLLDHLEEERRQGITIDTTQVFFSTTKRDYIIIDAPGHVEFVKNMITGASQAEAGILIVDANEGMKEQTKRHATIISMLGLDQVIAVINKMDLVAYKEGKFNELKHDISQFLRSLGVEAKSFIPISALKGDNVVKSSDNMPWYKEATILDSLDILKNKAAPENQGFIFAVQDIYKIDDKRVVVGRVETGSTGEGREVTVLPSREKTSIKSIERFLDNPTSCTAGESIGITTKDAVFLDRGNVLAEVGKEPLISDCFNASVFWMSKREFTKGEKLMLRCATQEISCKIEDIHKRINSSTLEVIENNAQNLKNSEIGDVTIKTKRPLIVTLFKDIQKMGRFVLVKADHIVAGGVVTYSESNYKLLFSKVGGEYL